jgi:hypothetical protein
VILFRHCERSEAIQSSVPHEGLSIIWRGDANGDRGACGTEDGLLRHFVPRNDGDA